MIFTQLVNQMTEKNNLNLIKDATSLMNSVRNMYNSYTNSFRNRILCEEGDEIEDTIFEKIEDDPFVSKLNSIESFLEDKNVSLAKKEILTAKKLIQKREYCEQIGLGNINAIQDYLNEAFIQLNNSR